MTFFMFGRYSAGSVQQISPERTQQARRAVENLGGQVKDIYALLGDYDLVIIAEFPRMGDAMKASVALKRLTDISFHTAPATPAEDFDKLMGEI